MNHWLFVYAAIGALFGFFAGLLGIGGGAVSVPLMTMAFAAQGFRKETILHVALATGMATIIFTSISSLLAHNRFRAVDWSVVRKTTPGIIVGTFLATRLVRHIPTFWLSFMLVGFLLYVAISLIFKRQQVKATRGLPGFLGSSVVGAAIGSVAGMVAIGGGVLVIPYLLFCSVPFRTAIGTSAALGLPIAISGATGYVINGLDQPGLPPHSLGYVYLPGLAGFVVGSVLAAPVGASLAHRTPVETLRRVFGVVVVALGVKMLISLL